jgi:hypothetical protein
MKGVGSRSRPTAVDADPERAPTRQISIVTPCQRAVRCATRRAIFAPTVNAAISEAS